MGRPALAAAAAGPRARRRPRLRHRHLAVLLAQHGYRVLAAWGQFRRVKGYQELAQLARAPKRATAEEPGLPAAVAGCP